MVSVGEKKGGPHGGQQEVGLGLRRLAFLWLVLSWNLSHGKCNLSLIIDQVPVVGLPRPVEWLGAVSGLATVTCPHTAILQKGRQPSTCHRGRNVFLSLASWFPGRWLSQVNTFHQ